ncbi:MAG: hypothetical protein PVJ98_11455, partial [Akkermansiaceae bacterium]
MSKMDSNGETGLSPRATLVSLSIDSGDDDDLSPFQMDEASAQAEGEFKEGEVKEEDGVTIPQVALTLDDVTEESAQQAIGVLTEKL